jgi:hypothetical protein
MKKVLLTIFVVAFFNNVNFAQSKCSIGIILGPNYVSFRGSDFFQNTESDYGSLVGGFVEYKINKSLSISSGFNFEQKALNYRSEYSYSYLNDLDQVVTVDCDVKTVNNYQYFSIPLLLKFRFGKNKSIFINGGVFSAHLQNHKKKRIITDKEGNSYKMSFLNPNFSLADEFQGLDCGLSFGFGKSFELTKKDKILLELRDSYGLKNIVEGINDYGQTGVVKSNTVCLIIGWSFDL